MNRRDFLRRSGGAALAVAPAIFVPQYGSWFKQLFARPGFQKELVKELVHGQAFHDYMMLAQRDLVERLRRSIDEMYIGGSNAAVPLRSLDSAGQQYVEVVRPLIYQGQVTMKQDYFSFPKRLPDLVVL